MVRRTAGQVSSTSNQTLEGIGVTKVSIMENEATRTLERLLAESYPAAFDVLTDPDLPD